MTQIAKTKWLPRHLLSFSFDIFILAVRTDLMRYSFDRYEYHYLVFEVSSFDKSLFSINIGRSESLEIAHEAYKRMTRHDGMDSRFMGGDDRTVSVGVDKGTDVTKNLKEFWKRLLK